MSPTMQNQEASYTEEIQEAIQNFENLKKDYFELKKDRFQIKKSNPFNLKFSGEKDNQNPKSFIESFEKIAVENDLNEFEKQYYFIASLVNKAASWLKTRRFGTYEKMKNDFLNFYWSPNKQKSFLKHLHVGKYNPNCGLSMSEYFLKYFQDSKYLETPVNEESVISDLLQHFDFKEEIQIAFEVQSAKTLAVGLDIIRKVEALKNSGQEEIQFTPISKKSTNSIIRNKRRRECCHLLLLLSLIIYTIVVIFNSKFATWENTNVRRSSNTDRVNNNCHKFIALNTLKFSGRKNSTHPKIFIQNFEHIAAQENFDEFSKKKLFIDSLVGDAQNWLSIHGYGSYEYMKEGLLDFYWNPSIQDMFLDFLRHGKYDEKSELSMSGYFFKYVNEAKLLDNPPSEKTVISDLLKHFDLKKEIRKSLKTRPVKNFEEALEDLVKAEAMNNYDFGKNEYTITVLFLVCLCISTQLFIIILQKMKNTVAHIFKN